MKTCNMPIVMQFVVKIILHEKNEVNYSKIKGAKRDKEKNRDGRMRTKQYTQDVAKD